MNIELSDKELSLIRFALWGMMNVAYDRANYAAQDKQPDSAGKVDRFLSDAKRCEALLARLKDEQYN